MVWEMYRLSWKTKIIQLYCSKYFGLNPMMRLLSMRKEQTWWGEERARLHFRGGYDVTARHKQEEKFSHGEHTSTAPRWS